MSATVLFATTFALTFAQSYPTRAVRYVQPNVPGGSGDVVARILGEKLSQALKQNFVVDNRPGAGTMIITELVAKSPRMGTQ